MATAAVRYLKVLDGTLDGDGDTVSVSGLLEVGDAGVFDVGNGTLKLAGGSSSLGVLADAGGRGVCVLSVWPDPAAGLQPGESRPSG